MSELDNLPNYVIDSRSAAEVDDACGMRYWWNYQEDGIGIVPAKESDYLTIGRDIHEDLASIAEMPESALNLGGIKELLSDLTAKLEVSPDESLARRIGWAASFALYLEPRIRKEFTNVQTEAEIILDRDPYFLPIVPDRVLEHRQDKYLVYREYKSTITANAKWIASWQFMPQIHLGITAIEEELEKAVKYGQVMGLLKGDRSPKDGRLIHPFAWVYKKGPDWSADYKPGWDAAPAWEYPGGIIEWVKHLGEEYCLGQFPHSYPIFCNKRLVDDWVSRREARLWQVASAKIQAQNDWDHRVIYFEPRTKQCRPAFGEECPYIKQCWNAAYNENPTLGREMVPRVPHHETERIWV